jgi:hypothetical protein
VCARIQQTTEASASQQDKEVNQPHLEGVHSSDQHICFSHLSAARSLRSVTLKRFVLPVLFLLFVRLSVAFSYHTRAAGGFPVPIKFSKTSEKQTNNTASRSQKHANKGLPLVSSKDKPNSGTSYKPSQPSYTFARFFIGCVCFPLLLNLGAIDQQRSSALNADT